MIKKTDSAKYTSGIAKNNISNEIEFTPRVLDNLKQSAKDFVNTSRVETFGITKSNTDNNETGFTPNVLDNLKQLAKERIRLEQQAELHKGQNIDLLA